MKRFAVLICLILATGGVGVAQLIGDAAQLEGNGRTRDAFQAYLRVAANSNADAAEAYAGAVRCARDLLADGTTDEEVLRGLQQAAQWYNSRIGDTMRVPAIDGLALAYLRQRKTVEAAAAYVTAGISLADVMDDPNFAFNYARAQEQAGRRAAAFRGYLRVLELAPDVESAAAGAIDTAATPAELIQVTERLSVASSATVSLRNILRVLDRTPQAQIVVHLARADLHARLTVADFRTSQDPALRRIAARLPPGEVRALINGLIAAFTAQLAAAAPERPFAAWNKPEERSNVMAALLTQLAGQLSSGPTLSDQTVLRQAAAASLCPLDPAILSQYLGGRLQRPDLPVRNDKNVDVTRLRIPEAGVPNPELPPRDPQAIKEEQVRLNMLAGSVGVAALPFRQRAAALDDELSSGRPSQYPGVQDLLGQEYERQGAIKEAVTAFRSAREGYSYVQDTHGLLRMDAALRRFGVLAEIQVPPGLVDVAALYANAVTPPTLLGMASLEPYLHLGQPDANGLPTWTAVRTVWAPAAMAMVEEESEPRGGVLALIAGPAGQFAVVEAARDAARTLAPRTALQAPAGPPTALAAYRVTDGKVYFFAGYSAGSDNCVARFVLDPEAPGGRYEFLGWLPSSGTECSVTDIAVDAQTGTLFVLNLGTVYAAQSAVPISGTNLGAPTTLVPTTLDRTGPRVRGRIFLDGQAARLITESSAVISASPAGPGPAKEIWAATAPVVNIRLCSGRVSACLAVLLNMRLEIIGLVPARDTCDLNEDGVVNGADVQLAINQTLGLAPCTAAARLGLQDCNAVFVQRVIVAS